MIFFLRCLKGRLERFLIEKIRALKNVIGRQLSYGCCPACGNSWWWKKEWTPIYYQFYKDYRSGLILCKECYTQLNILDLHLLKLELYRRGWPEDKLILVERSIRMLQEDRET